VQTQVLHDTVAHLGAELDRARFPLDVPGAGQARQICSELIAQIEDYLLPRLREINAPLLAVVGGSTGAGKSTVVNSLIGRTVSVTGVLRPTTTTPILVTHPGDIHWFEGDRILPTLARSTGSPASDSRALHLIADADVPRGLALLDAPDIDSIVRTNRELASQLLASADLWMFVTTAARYADAVPWEFLRQARERSTALAVVLNRVPQEALDQVPSHLAEMLRREGLEDAPVLTVSEVPLVEGLIPERAFEPVRNWLRSLDADAGARAQVIMKTLVGALDSLPRRVELIAGQLEAQIAAADALRGEVEEAYSGARMEVEESLSGGSLLRSEVLARWHEFVGTGDVMRNLQSAISRFRDRVTELVSGRPPVDRAVRIEVERNIEAVVVAASDKAAERTLASWRASSHGRGLIEQGRVRPNPPALLRASVEGEVRAWQGTVLDLVRAQGATKREAGRAMSLGVNVVGAAVMIAVFAHTGGLTGGEVVIAGGTAAVSQRLLEALFGDEAVRTLTMTARRDLLKRLHGLLDAGAEPFVRAAHRDSPTAAEIESLRSALGTVEAARK
jgi:hypothetical protein